MAMAQFMICNIGYRPIVLTRLVAVGATSTYHMGIDDEPAAVLGKQDQRFPSLIEPGETLKIHPIGIEALRRNITDPADPKVYHDPFRYFVLVDSFGRFHPMDAEDILFKLHILTRREVPRGWRSVLRGWGRRRFLRSARKRIRETS